MSVRRLADPSVQPMSFAAGAVVWLAIQAGMASAATDGRLVSADLLRIGFKLAAEGDLLTEREFGFNRLMDEGIFVHSPPQRPCDGDPAAFVADMSAVNQGLCRYPDWTRSRYDGYVRMSRGREEFVCILGRSENCYRVFNASDRENEQSK